MYIISECLIGHNCKYNGGNNRNENVIAFAKEHNCVFVCPETAGGLPSPRPPAEQQMDHEGRILVRDREGKDVTAGFIIGAEKCFKEAMIAAKKAGEPIEGAILKAKSPSCGCEKIYDGTFSGTLKEGDGIFAAMLKNAGIPVSTEESFT